MAEQLPPLDDLLKESLALKRKSLELITLSCKQCGVFFKPVREWQHFCSDRCRATFHKTAKAVEAQTISELQAENERLREELRQLKPTKE